MSDIPRNFGKAAKGERLARIQASPQYVDGAFRNQVPTELFTSEKGRFSAMVEFMFGPKKHRKPQQALPTVATDLKSLDANKDLLVWLGHSSFYFQIAGKRVLLDPVLGEYAAPLPWFNRAFKGDYPFQAEDMPEVDYLLITHDHWDHLDYPSLKVLRDRVKQVIAPLGVGAHLEHWGFESSRIREVDWYEDFELEAGLMLHSLPARHFSGRGPKSNQTLWVSYLFETAERKIYFSGDSGYAPHFAEIGERFGGVDLAIMENGQYDPSWAQIHMQPEETAKAGMELKAAAILPAHAGRFTLSNHSWDAPYKGLVEACERKGLKLLTPRMGEVFELDDPEADFPHWWHLE